MEAKHGLDWSIAVLAQVSSIVTIGGAAYWVHDINTRLQNIETKADIGLGSSSEQYSRIARENSADDKLLPINRKDRQRELNSVKTGQTVLVELCDDIGKRLALANSIPDHSVIPILNLTSQFTSLNCISVFEEK
jgi:hypothetical protein